ncbi:MAG TPA: hypothetical protein VFJ58_18580 [Armatimonadota bacterium]|nr:hypothetical protein [Armatimonadota bacterium]
MDLESPEPRWPSLLALLAVGGLYAALPENLSAGPRWMVLVIVSILTIPVVVAHRRGHHALTQAIGYTVESVVTIAMIWSVTLLVMAVPTHKEQPVKLLQSAIVLWLTNVLVFALWYWRLDAGGPHARDMTPGHSDGAFLFPQMAMAVADPNPHTSWSPQFVDYLFLAFNTSTALSPTDTAVLSRWAKLLMMIQSAISLTVVAILAARAVNIL